MNGDGPCQPQGKLCKTAEHIFFQGLRCFIKGIADIIPFFSLHFYFCVIALHKHGIFFQLCYHSDLSVEIPLTPVSNIIFDEHYLCTHFQVKRFIGRVSIFRKVIFYLGIILHGCCIQLLQLRYIYISCLFIVCGKYDVAIIFFSPDRRIVAGLENMQTIFIQFIIPHLVQYPDKFLFTLPVYFIKLDIKRLFFFYHLAIEKISTVVEF